MLNKNSELRWEPCIPSELLNLGALLKYKSILISFPLCVSFKQHYIVLYCSVICTPSPQVFVSVTRSVNPWRSSKDWICRVSKGMSIWLGLTDTDNGCYFTRTFSCRPIWWTTGCFLQSFCDEDNGTLMMIQTLGSASYCVASHISLLHLFFSAGFTLMNPALPRVNIKNILFLVSGRGIAFSDQPRWVSG